MPKLPSLTPQEIIKVLEKKGFVLDRIKGSHHIRKRDLPKGTLLEILKQADISKEELRDLV